MNNGLNYELVRYAAKKRIAVIGNSATISDLVTIASHDYLIHYYAGTHFDRCDYKTTCTVIPEDSSLRFRLTMEEPYLKRILKHLKTTKSADFWQGDFVSLNFIAKNNRLFQVGVKVDGSIKTFTQYREKKTSLVRVTIERFPKKWQATVELPLKALGFSLNDLAKYPIPFDIVRYHGSNTTITSWCPIPDQPPFTENYRFPVFCFGLLSVKPVSWSKFCKTIPEIGTIVYSGPKTARAGEFIRFAITYTAGKYGFQPGGRIKYTISNEVMECNRKSPVFKRFPEKDWSRLQWDKPEKEGFVAITCSNKNAVFERSDDNFFEHNYKLTSRNPLKPGDTVTLSFGTDKRGPGIRTQLLHQDNFPFKVFLDPSGNGIFHTPERFPEITISGRKAQALLIHTQPTPDAGEKFRLVIVAIDYYGNIDFNYAGTVKLFCDGKLCGVPSKITFFKKERGIKILFASIRKKGVFTIRAVDAKDSSINGESNLIVTDGTFGPGKIVFGDIHTHSQCSDGRLPLDQKYRELALHRGLDFWSLTDHAYDITTERLANTGKLFEKVNNENEFATIYGYEWSCSDGQFKPIVRGMYGHRNVHFREVMDRVFDGLSPESNSPQKLKKALQKHGKDYTIINHFHCGNPRSYRDIDENFEICSWCKNTVRETLDDKKHSSNASVVDLFNKGFRGGVFAGSDHGSETYYAGLEAELTGVYAGKLTRDNIFWALKNGRGYATTGQKVLLKFTINNVSPANNAKPITAKKRKIHVIAGCSMPVFQIIVFKNGKQFFAKNYIRDYGKSKLVRLFLTDDDTSIKKGYYYVRVHTAQGHITWSSPVFYKL